MLRSVADRLRNVLFVLVYVVLLVVGLPVLLVCAIFGLRETFVAYGQWMMRVGRDILDIKVEASGIDKLDRRTPYIFTSNHLSFLDGPLLTTVLDRPTRFIVKRFVVRIPVLGWGMRLVGYVPVDKEGVGEGKTRIARAVSLVKERGYSFVIFPEGTRSFDGRLQPFRRGGFFLALETGAPIVPVSIKGSYELMPRRKWLIRKGNVHVTFHEPIPVTSYAPETVTELTAKVRAAIISAL
jgi:1-acyl-sn-glycerol-3-phosphate acyltransferase